MSYRKSYVFLALTIAPILVPLSAAAQSRDSYARQANDIERRAIVKLGNRDFVAAERDFRSVLSLRSRWLGINNRNTAHAHTWLAQALNHQRKFDEAINQANLARRIYRLPAVRSVAGQAAALASLVSSYIGKNEPQKALQVAKESYELNKNTHGMQHEATAQALVNLAAMAEEVGNFDESIQYIRSAIRTLRQLQLSNPSTLPIAYNNLAKTLNSAGRHAEAITELSAAIAEFRKLQTSDPANEESAWTNLATAEKALGRYKRAELLFKHALSVNLKIRPRQSAEVARAMNNLAVLYSDMGRYAESRKLQEEALSIRKVVHGEGDSRVALSENNLGWLLYLVGDLQQAQEKLANAMTVHKKVFGPKSGTYLTAMGNLALTEDALGNHQRAVELQRESLATEKATLGNAHPSTIQDMVVLAGFLEKNSPAEARQFYEEALACSKESLGREHPKTASAQAELAGLELREGNVAASRQLLESAYEASLKTLGPAHDHTLLRRVNLAGVVLLEGETQAAVELFDEGRRQKMVFLANAFPGLSPAEQERFLAWNYDRGVQRAMSLALTHPESDLVATKSANWLANGKGMGQWALAQRTLLRRADGRAELRAIANDLREAQRKLARNAVNDSGGAGGVNENQILEQTIAELQRKLATEGGSDRFQRSWVEPKQITAALGRDSCLIDIARLSVFDENKAYNKDAWGPEKYVGWITAPNGSVSVVDLGEAESIDNQIDAVRQQIRAAHVLAAIKKDGAVVTEAAMRTTTSALTESVLKPILSAVKAQGSFERLVISADSQLWTLPWAALPVSETDRYLIEDYELTFVLSAADLVREKSSRQTSASVIFANPDFNLPGRDKRQAIQRVLNVTARSTGVASDGKRRLPQVDSLPGTASESATIAAHLETLGQEPLLRTGSDALEMAVKQLRSPNLAVFSTHGFFFADQTPNAKQQNGDTRTVPRTSSGELLQNPFLRCGLLFAGCNNPGSSFVDDDGVLTGLEVLETDLRGTALVVLSACETGLGEIRNGDGVAGLSQAFQLAGADEVIASLWVVSDGATARLMGKMFNRYTDGKSASPALRDAQLEMIREYRRIHGAAHPFFWASFMLTGAGRI